MELSRSERPAAGAENAASGPARASVVGRADRSPALTTHRGQACLAVERMGAWTPQPGRARHLRLLKHFNWRRHAGRANQPA
jgi:hypothetical protein